MCPGPDILKSNKGLPETKGLPDSRLCPHTASNILQESHSRIMQARDILNLCLPVFITICRTTCCIWV